MGSLSGVIQRPLMAAVAVAMASVSADFSAKLPSPSIEQIGTSTSSVLPESTSSLVALISASKLPNLSFVTRIHVPLPSFYSPVNISGRSFVPDQICSSIASSPLMMNLYQSAELDKASKPAAAFPGSVPIPAPVPDVLYRWHLPEPTAIDMTGTSDCSSAKSRTVVVLLGWLGSKQKHLKRYSDWYTSRGYHVITFTLPMVDIIGYQAGGKAEQNVDMLVHHLADWLEEEQGKNLVFHTFSNTGWLMYGAILEKFQKEDPSLMERIRGCIVDSAPVAAPDPQVWASGFSAAFLKKHSVATKGFASSSESDMGASVGKSEVSQPQPAVTEAALLLVLEKFFDVVLNLPGVKRRLSDVLGLLSYGQPTCPQLYIYSSADRVIPADSVESFIEKQKRSGREVRACNFVSTPHVDHFRNDPNLYTSQLSHFLEDCVLTCCKHS
ncbi:dihydroorotate dehydrogenase (quinone) [Hibiscus syriacus]|uniref:Dihydroorotate dehydrogenase (Quinone) n=1 Tax=Hibiscus syriacus TaxID=106335 RepID=A0A6A3BN21_HIBSY|nr:transmembrane protein 53-like [Hibiscus syriacus]KAE8716828.1 dihydroorotate dehydrogenase (quinone) [Hibiscus syriacus]